MLRPQETATRETKNLDGVWEFRVDTEGVGRAENWYAGPLAESRPMAVPASYNDIVADAATRDHSGDVWYQRLVRVPRGWQDRRVVRGSSTGTTSSTTPACTARSPSTAPRTPT